MEIVDDSATAERPLSFRASLRWGGDESTDVRTGSAGSLAPPFPRPPGLMLFARDDAPVRDEANPQCWRVDEEQSNLGSHLAMPVNQLQPGEELTTEYELWTREADKCLPVGSYTVKQQVRLELKPEGHPTVQFSFRTTDEPR